MFSATSNLNCILSYNSFTWFRAINYSSSSYLIQIASSFEEIHFSNQIHAIYIIPLDYILTKNGISIAGIYRPPKRRRPNLDRTNSHPPSVSLASSSLRISWVFFCCRFLWRAVWTMSLMIRIKRRRQRLIIRYVVPSTSTFLSGASNPGMFGLCQRMARNRNAIHCDKICALEGAPRIFFWRVAF